MDPKKGSQVRAANRSLLAIVPLSFLLRYPWAGTSGIITGSNRKRRACASEAERLPKSAAKPAREDPSAADLKRREKAANPTAHPAALR